MGRNRLLPDKQVEALASRWKVGETLETLSQEAGVSLRTLERALRRLGVPPARGIRKTKLGAVSPYHFGVVGEWLRNNPGASLPPNVKDIAKLIGCSEKAVSSYLYRIKEEVKKMALTLRPEDLGRAYPDTRGRYIPMQAVASWKINIAPWTFEIILDGKLRGEGGTFSIKLSLTKLRDISGRKATRATPDRGPPQGRTPSPPSHPPDSTTPSLSESSPTQTHPE